MKNRVLAVAIILSANMLLIGCAGRTDTARSADPHDQQTLTADTPCNSTPQDCLATAMAALRDQRNDDEAISSALGLQQAACNQGYLLACEFLGLNYVNGRYGLNDPMHGISLLEGACNLGQVTSCNWLVGAALRLDLPEHQTDRYAERAVQAFENLCEAGNDYACLSLADMRRSSGLYPADEAAAVRALQLACSRNSADACEQLAVGDE